MQLAAVADVGQRDQLAAGEAHDGGNPEGSRRARGKKSRVVRPEGVNHVERSVGVQAAGKSSPRGEERLARPARARRETQVVDGGPAERPVARPGLLREREDVRLVARREPLDQPEKRRNDALRPTPVDAARDDDGEAHATC